MPRKRRDWIVMGPGDGQIQCLRCGKKRDLDIPSPIAAFILEMKAFGLKHELCEPTKSPWGKVKMRQPKVKADDSV
jgi:hypothetical protein